MGKHQTLDAPRSNVIPRLSVFGLLGVLYTAAMSGSYGLEASVQAAGPFYTLVALIAIPVFWGLPSALSITELACALPSNAGPPLWINVAFHSYFSGALSTWTMLLNFVDNSLYPTVFADYYAAVFGLGKTETNFVKLAFIWACGFINILGIDFVGKLSFVMMCIDVSPFAIMFIIQLTQHGGFDWPRIASVPENVNWALFLPVVCWNFSGFDSVGNFTEEVINPQRNVLRSMLMLVVLGLLTYIPPVLVGASAPGLRHLPWKEWGDGFWVRVGLAEGGQILSHIVLLGSSVSSFGMMMSMMAGTSRSLAGAGQLGVLGNPVSPILAQYHPTWRTPVAAILLNSVLTSLLCLYMDFNALVEVDQILYCIRLAAIMAAFIKLRVSNPNLLRPYKVPGGWLGVVYAGVCPLICSVALVIISVATSLDALYTTSTVILVVSAFSYFSVKFIRGGLGFEGELIDVDVDSGEDDPLQAVKSDGLAGQAHRPHPDYDTIST